MIRSKLANSKERLKELDSILQPDIRVPFLGSAGEEYLLKFYKTIDLIKIIDIVPEDVRVNFETAKNTLLHSYFCYRLTMPATLFALSAVELAVVKRAEISGYKFKKNDGLKKKLSVAFVQDWINIQHVAAPLNEPDDWAVYAKRAFIPWIVGIRNNLAHEPLLLDFPVKTCENFEVFAKIINYLFSKTHK